MRRLQTTIMPVPVVHACCTAAVGLSRLSRVTQPLQPAVMIKDCTRIHKQCMPHTGPQLQPQQKAVQALSGEHGHTVAAFAVMLIEAGLLSLERLEQQSFAETCASEPCHISASGTGSPNTRKARYEW